MKEKNVIYAIAGDMLRGSIIDSEYKGLSTIEVMNLLTQIGRFDILFDEFHNRIDSYTWELIPITEDRCPHDTASIWL